MSARTAKVARKTGETDISLEINLDGQGNTSIQTGVGFLDHMLSALARHARFDVTLSCKGDTQVDDHHSAEDCALVIGEGISKALSERKGILRFGSAYAPLDEALARAVVDLSGRPFAYVDLGLERDRLGDLSCENVPHIFESLSVALRASIHIDVLRGKNDHHRAEAAFKALALALRQAVSRDGTDLVPSTKGVL